MLPAHLTCLRMRSSLQMLMHMLHMPRVCSTNFLCRATTLQAWACTAMPRCRCSMHRTTWRRTQVGSRTWHGMAWHGMQGRGSLGNVPSQRHALSRPAQSFLCCPLPTPAAAEEEGEEVASSPGYSPFAGAQEPGSESPPFGLPLSNGATAVEQAAQAGAAEPESGPSRLLATLPTAALAAGSGRRAAEWEAEGAVHGSSMALGSLEQARQQQPRTATLPRPISADNLRRVASLAYGIPGVRTRVQVGSPGWLHLGWGGQGGRGGV